MKNLGTNDRLLRVIVAEICLLVAFFWMPMEWQIPLYLIAAVMIFEAATGSSGFYRLLGRDTSESVKRKDKDQIIAFIAIALILALVGSVTSVVITKNIYNEDLNKFIGDYESLLKYSEMGQKNVSIEQYIKIKSSLSTFQKKYSTYRPFSVRFDKNFEEKNENITQIIFEAEQDIQEGNLSQGKKKLLEANPIIREMQRT